MPAGSSLPPSLSRVLARPVPAGSLSDIEHVVFVMQENRSFDHYFGRMRGVRGFGDRNAVATRACRSVFEQDGVLPFPVREAAEDAGADPMLLDTHDHSWLGTQNAWAMGWHDAWVPNKGHSTMAYYDRHDLPLHYELADAFTICDAYHSSALTSTTPNRNYHISGYTGYEPGTGQRAVDNDACEEDGHAGYTWVTVPELLSQAGHSWQVYQEWDNYQCNNLEFFATFKAVMAKLGQTSMHSFYEAVRAADDPAPLLAGLDERVARLDPADRELYDRALRRTRTGGLGEWFSADVAAGRLPAVSYIVTSLADSEHPEGSSAVESGKIIYQVLDAIASQPEVWGSTAVFITYDENDGFFDHVPPPVPPDGTPGEFVNGRPLGLGVRVPMIVVSPWTVGGNVCSETFDHSSTVRFLESWLGIKAPDISAWRRTVVGDLTSAFDFDAPPAHPVGKTPAPQSPAADLPASEVAASGVPASGAADPGVVASSVVALGGAASRAATPSGERWYPAVPAEQRMPVQEPGTRRARALPYQPDASARTTGRAVEITMSNGGAASAHLTLYSYLGELVRPQHFDVLGDLREVVYFPTDAYDLVLTGPNGFRREFRGVVEDPVEVTSEIDAATRTITFHVRNTGDSPAHVTISPLAYGGAPEAIQVASGTTGHFPWKTETGWYDLKVIVAGNTTFARRLMGHIENGRPSVTG
ncbi:phospholipase C, phosphocholine-specific [Planotetraspora sp. A-T 1434]|uniref:phosphocholine-specific phospholipase C n=1 Tax=Planotetraspora sp. A-T 1434 TaxID=2979219 RepID=UPI0021BF4BD3|nr:phospholipase C, phosphocholine-specific [Planotetraspora sp. A-T 1434]MCT9930934.1 phospholipase C, phosphocholine-specific [Planotetraspora sp. A-T 1434]